MRHFLGSRALREIQKSMRERGSKCATFAQNHNIWTHCACLLLVPLWSFLRVRALLPGILRKGRRAARGKRKQQNNNNNTKKELEGSDGSGWKKSGSGRAGLKKIASGRRAFGPSPKFSIE